MALEAAGVLAGVLLIALLAVIAIRVKAIDASGAVAGALITLATFFAGWFSWLFVMVAFFVISSVLTRFRYDYKLSIASAQEKGGTRSWPNTVANGLVSALAALAYLYSHQELFVIVFLGAVSVAMSDTIATEVGLLSNSKPRAITDPRRYVEPGTSGGVSFLGELAATISSFCIGILAIVLRVVPYESNTAVLVLLSVVVGGIVGTNFDSLLGGTVQSLRKCTVCGAFTENRSHHNRATTVVRGSRFVDNNVVNFIAIAFGAAVAVLLFSLA
ncbi:MAG: DUF92 domain-containing protein [Nitrososphaerota archaeon]|nr:DUF92 domain-containing protein [Nitrososphaerota archaeon]